jgi:transcriptional regulator with XRE-family HTH domain
VFWLHFAQTNKTTALSKTLQKDLAKLLYTSDARITQQEIADRVGVALTSINRWAQAEDWEHLRKGLLTSRRTILADLYDQLDELRTLIKDRPKGQRYPSTKEADTVVKLTSAIRNFENETSVADLVDVGMKFLDYVREIDPHKVSDAMALYDSFIKSNLR